MTLRVSLNLLFILLSGLTPSKSLNANLNDQVIYSLMIDRFLDGDKSNNTPLYAYKKNNNYDKWNKKILNKIYDPTKKSWNKYWGGDLKGLYKKLEYIKELGITAVMISPIFQNVNGYISIAGTGPRITAYHGYWLKDLYRIDEHFISYDPKKREDLYQQGENLLKSIIDKSHDLGLKVILDVNLNHSSPSIEGLKQIAKLKEYELQDGAIFMNGELISTHSEYFEDKFKIKPAHKDWFNKCPSIVWEPEARKDKKAEYKKMGCSIYGDEPSKYEMHNFMLHGLADFNHGNKMVQNYLIGAMKKWTKMGVDGYRIDAARHMPEGFILKLIKDLKKINPHIFFISEWFKAGARHKDAVAFSKKTGSWLFDFEKMKEIRNIYLDGKINYSELKQIINKPSKAIIFIENQDIPRILSLKHINTSMYDEMLKLIFLVPGVPCIYYGTEQYLHNESYKYNRKSFGQVGADPWNRDAMNWNLKDHKSKKAYSIINRLSYLKNKNPALKKGKIKLIETDEQTLAFERIYKDQKILYISSTKKGSNRLEIKTSLKNGKYKDPISMKEYTVSQKRLSLELKPFSSVILVSSN